MEFLHSVMDFTGLHLTESFKAMICTLKGVAGVYAIIHISTGRAYVGSSANIGLRLMSHLVYGSCNPHLQNALALYGLSTFMVRLVAEFIIDPALSDEENAAKLLALEQYWLDLLFSLPAAFRYNFLPHAGSSLGYVHKEETKIQISKTLKGSTRSLETRAKISAGQSGANNHKATAVALTDLNGFIVREFLTQIDAAKYLKISKASVSLAIKRGSIVEDL
ncbi:hypothetical protein BC936DRAFT_146281 [Jimgerdemannia flammicorona]|uniref:GIY-YIG domain-containing protein n=1 Tax=Jimgerdemannia flammicorona TaxID=994334 RepID=A0A433D829_9FUNG|nr:hypothetical protein BC936DRAFT_146281 [Jimgerdemannia flammicorona]